MATQQLITSHNIAKYSRIVTLSHAKDGLYIRIYYQSQVALYLKFAAVDRPIFGSTPRKNTWHTHKQNLARMWPVRGSNPHQTPRQDDQVIKKNALLIARPRGPVTVKHIYCLFHTYVTK